MQRISLVLDPTSLPQRVLLLIYNPPESTNTPRALFLLPALSLSAQYQSILYLPSTSKSLSPATNLKDGLFEPSSILFGSFGVDPEGHQVQQAFFSLWSCLNSCPSQIIVLGDVS